MTWLARASTLLVLAMVLGCSRAAPGDSSAALGPTPSAGTMPETSGTPDRPTLAPTETAPEATAPPATTPSPIATPRGDRFPEGMTLRTIEDRVRVRSAPGTGDDSRLYEPVLPAGTALFVLNGPREADGYAWYEVVPIGFRLEDSAWGWVAAGSRDGQAWLAPGSVECPPQPDDFNAVRATAIGHRLACFSGVPITIEARIVPCNCDIDGGAHDPPWFGYGTTDMLTAPTTDPATANLDDGILLHLDPQGAYPDQLPTGEVVTVTGVFDHPAAAECTVAGFDEPPEPSSTCRFVFAVIAVS